MQYVFNKTGAPPRQSELRFFRRGAKANHVPDDETPCLGHFWSTFGERATALAAIWPFGSYR
jgi:hypothetical protein